jgi:hypothetical protein
MPPGHVAIQTSKLAEFMEAVYVRFVEEVFVLDAVVDAGCRLQNE